MYVYLLIASRFRVDKLDFRALAFLRKFNRIVYERQCIAVKLQRFRGTQGFLRFCSKLSFS